MEYDWSAFNLRINILNEPAAVWEYLATPGGWESWFLRQCLVERGHLSLNGDAVICPNDRYEWLWHGYPDEVCERGTFLSVSALHDVRFTFTGGRENNMEVSITLEALAGGKETLVVLNQTNIPLNEEARILFHIGCMKGWTFYLTNLKSLAEGGLDLRNKAVQLKDMVNA